MKATFNAVCSWCRTFKPRCAVVYRKIEGRKAYSQEPRTWCEDCRRLNRGKYGLDDRHK